MKHKHCDLIKAWADGAKVQIRSKHNPAHTWTEWRDLPCPTWNAGDGYEYRIKPKEDIVLYAQITDWSEAKPFPKIAAIDSCKTIGDNVALTFDGDTGKLKAAVFIGKYENN